MPADTPRSPNYTHCGRGKERLRRPFSEIYVLTQGLAQSLVNLAGRLDSSAESKGLSHTSFTVEVHFTPVSDWGTRGKVLVPL